MIKYIKQQLALRRLREQLRARYWINPEFLKSAKESFVAMAGLRAQRAGVRVARWSHAWRYATVAVVAVLSMTTGLAVFAQKNDVPPDHPLYQLKRLGEHVRLAVSSPAQQVELRQEYVSRRLKEIILLKAEEAGAQLDISVSPEATLTPHQTRLQELGDDLQKEAESAIDQSEDIGNRKEKHAQVCGQILEAVDHASTSAPVGLRLYLKARCEESPESK